MAMKIAPATAMNIVRELKNVIKEDLTFMDTSCRIIACTDETRIGDYHAASEKMFRENLKELRVESDSAYTGTRAGINMAIEAENETAAVVGITGNYESVAKYGRIIKKMTEILLLEDQIKEQKRRERNTVNRFLQQWLIADETEMGRQLVDEGRAAGIDVYLLRRIAVMTIYNPSNKTISQDTVDLVERRIRHVLREDVRSVSAGIGNCFVALISDRSDQQLRELLMEIARKVRSEADCELCLGADSAPVGGAQIKDGYARALKAAKAAAPGTLVFYDDILLELVTGDLPEETRQEFIHRVFKGCETEKIPEYLRILSVFYACNGSLQEASERLFMHKNTIQYRIRRLGELTGRDPRALNEVPLFSLAILLSRKKN